MIELCFSLWHVHRDGPWRVTNKMKVWTPTPNKFKSYWTIQDYCPNRQPPIIHKRLTIQHKWARPDKSKLNEVLQLTIFLVVLEFIDEKALRPVRQSLMRPIRNYVVCSCSPNPTTLTRISVIHIYKHWQKYNVGCVLWSKTVFIQEFPCP